ncbi:MAG: bifunctional isocitrate dehydrogenase kinase/phosphatase, partial [Rhodoferax sp.]|nr:bifunctional isocitrate dehydrogenase kinase/phosphatase [Rhodoferax sp.]
MFPHRLTDSRAFEIARALIEGFDRHYRLFSQTNLEAKARFEAADWHGQQRAQRERIEYYDKRVDEAAERLQREFQAGALKMDVWQQVKLHYIGLLVDHKQPELAETFFNSVTTKILHRSYFHNDFIFVRPAVATEYIESDGPGALPTYRAYYPQQATWRSAWRQMVQDFGLTLPFEDLDRDIDDVASTLEQVLGAFTPRANFQIQVLSSLFFRNKAAYVVGKVINGFQETPFALPILHGRSGLLIDTVLHSEDDLLMLFSYARAYFMVHMDVPSAYVQFLRSLMPRKPRAELYSALGLQKQGKNS